MNVLLIGFTVLMSLAVGWSIGANDAANSLGTAVGSRVINLRQGIILIAIFGFLGAFLQGSHVTATIGKGIIPMDQLDKQAALYVALVACFAA
ncbi:MAG: inorganic phosphate transporter, partial [Candidatus Omnitrophota bacterium]